MRKFFAALLFAIALVFTVAPVGADELDRNTDRYLRLGENSDGNESFIDKSTIRHQTENMTTYAGVLRLSNRSDLFNKAKDLVTDTQVPLYVLSNITVDCSGQRIKTGKIIIIGVDTNDERPTIKILWSSNDGSSTDWTVVPNGIKQPAKGLLCGPSF